MVRYVRDEKLRDYQAKVRKEVAEIAKAASGGGYFIYVIHDPSKEDPRGVYQEGPPVYVGQSKQMLVRADSHMRDGGGGSTDDSIKTDRLKEIMDKYIVPKFRIVDTAPSHLTSLIAETVWARRYVWLGYELANRWPEHRIAERPQGLKSVPTKRLRKLTVAEAIEDEVALAIDCRRCRIYHEVNLETLKPTLTINRILGQKLRCESCGRPTLRAKKPNPVTWRWADYAPRPMPPHRRKTLPASRA